MQGEPNQRQGDRWTRSPAHLQFFPPCTGGSRTVTLLEIISDVQRNCRIGTVTDMLLRAQAHTRPNPSWFAVTRGKTVDAGPFAERLGAIFLLDEIQSSTESN